VSIEEGTAVFENEKVLRCGVTHLRDNDLRFLQIPSGYENVW
jgi:hypothetical protein